MDKFTRVLAVAGFAMLPLASQAATPTLGEVLKASGITANGYVDFGTTLNNRGAENVGGIGGLNGATEGSFRLNQIGLAVTTALSENFSGTLDLLAGQDAIAVASDETAGIKLKQAYVSYTNGGLTVMGGRFVTLAGAEVINSSQNQNATRGLLFTLMQPLSHTGVRASYSFGKMVTLTGGLLNSSNSTAVNDNNHNKSYEVQVAVTPFDGFTNAVTFLQGQEATGNGASPMLIDVVSSLQITKALSVGMNYDHARNGGVNQAFTFGRSTVTGSAVQTNGVALYSSFQLCDALRLGARGEYIEGVASPTTADNRVEAFEYTATADYAVSKNFNVLTDVRFDKLIGNTGTGNLNAFGNSTEGAGNAMTSLTIKGIYRF